MMSTAPLGTAAIASSIRAFRFDCGLNGSAQRLASDGWSIRLSETVEVADGQAHDRGRVAGPPIP